MRLSLMHLYDVARPGPLCEASPIESVTARMRGFFAEKAGAEKVDA